MKILKIFIISLILAGCTAKFTIPDEPRFKRFQVYQVEQGVCLDHEGISALRYNMEALKDYADKMRKTLEDLQK